MTATDSTKHQKSKALKPGSRRPAKELCSECGLCDTYYIHYVKESCAFLTQHIAELEAEIHGRSRNLDNPDDWYFGVSQNMMAARKKEPIEGAQWTGIVSTIAIEMLEKGISEEALIKVQPLFSFEGTIQEKIEKLSTLLST